LKPILNKASLMACLAWLISFLSRHIGSVQLFLNKKNENRYARFRHYKGLNENKKPQFDHHKVEELEKLKTLLQNKGFQFSAEAKASRSQGQGVVLKTHDPHLRSSSFICQNMGRVAQHGQSITLLRWGSWVQIPPRPH
jgi:hypothetical protein